MRHRRNRLALQRVEVELGLELGINLANDADVRPLHDLRTKRLLAHARAVLNRVLALVTVAQHDIDLLVISLERAHEVPPVCGDHRHGLLDELLDGPAVRGRVVVAADACVLQLLLP